MELVHTFQLDHIDSSETFNGQLTQFGYDFDGDLMSQATSAGTTSYRYDPLGRQVSRTVGGVETGYYLDGDSVLLEKQNGATTGTYTYGLGLIRRSGEYPLEDGRGNVRDVSQADESVGYYNVLDAFGRTVFSSGTTSVPSFYGAGSGYRSDGDAPASIGALLKAAVARKKYQTKAANLVILRSPFACFPPTMKPIIFAEGTRCP